MEEKMENKNFWLRILVLVFGLAAFVKCYGNPRIDMALNGTWLDDEIGLDEWKFNNGNYETSVGSRGTYSTDGNILTFKVTHVHGLLCYHIVEDMPESWYSEWYSKSELKTVLKAKYQYIMDKEEIDEAIDEFINGFFSDTTGTYSVSGNKLTFSMNGWAIVFTKK
jgi:hypothetical protein